MAHEYHSESKAADLAIRRIPKELKKRPKNFKEFQNFYFFWVEEGEDPSYNKHKIVGLGLHEGKVSKAHKLALWNAKRIKGKKLTEDELYRIHAICDPWRETKVGGKFTDGRPGESRKRKFSASQWKDSDNPKPKPPAEKKKQSDSTQREISL